MPYKLSKDGKTVLNADTGESVPGGKHPNHKSALKHLAALEINVPDAKKKESMTIKERINNFVATLKAKGDGKSGYLVSDNGKGEPALPTKKDGALSRSLCGAAWAALHGGYRGNKYEGEGKAEAIKKLTGIYKRNGWDLPKEKESTFFIDKDSAGNYRWVGFSTNAFEDTDKEIVSLAALEEDTDRMNETGNYGPLRWWHVGLPDVVKKEAGAGIDIGTCDFSALHGKILIESGIIPDEEIALALKEGDWQMSRSFFHNTSTDPDANGVYQHIYGFERSVLPRGRAANTLTAFVVKENDMAKLKEKFDAFAKLLGKDKAEAVVKSAEGLESIANELGIASKEAKPHEHDGLASHAHGEDGMSDGDVKSHKHGEDGKMVEKEIKATLKENIDAVQKCFADMQMYAPSYAQQEAMDISSATYAMNQIVQLIASEADAGEPKDAALLATTLDQLWEFIKGEMAELLAEAGGETTEGKEKTEVNPTEVTENTTEVDLTALVQKAIEPITASLKESQGLSEQVKQLNIALTTTLSRLDKAEKELKQLNSTQPRGFKASAAKETIVTDPKLKEAAPKQDPATPEVANDFLKFAMTGQP